jgi:hypothetical protein
LGEPLRAPLVRSRRAIRSITRPRFAVAGGSASIPLAKRGFAPQLKIKNIIKKACIAEKLLYLCINTFVFICLGF